MPPETPAATDPTILSTPPPVVPVAPETVLYTPPAAPEATPPVTPPVAVVPPVVPPVTPPATPPTETKPPTEPIKPEVPATPVVPPTDYVLKLPEGSLLSPEDVAAVAKDAKAAGLTQEQAEGVLKTRGEAVKAFADRQEQTVAKLRDQWKEECAKDPMIGGEKFAENAELARRGFNAIADLELQQWMEKTGFGNYPPVVRALTKLGQMMAEDRMVRGSVGAPPARKAPEDILYGDTTPLREPMS